MNASKRELIEIVGILAVVASLIFVGMQLRLDRKVALADQYFNRAESVKADRRSRLESEAYLQDYEDRWALGWRPPYWNVDSSVAKQLEAGKLSVRSFIVRTLSLQLDIVGYDNLYFQVEQGLLDEDWWSGMRSNLKQSMARDELVRLIYRNYARPAVRPVIEELLSEIESEGTATEAEN